MNYMHTIILAMAAAIWITPAGCHKNAEQAGDKVDAYEDAQPAYVDARIPEFVSKDQGFAARFPGPVAVTYAAATAHKAIVPGMGEFNVNVAAYRGQAVTDDNVAEILRNELSLSLPRTPNSTLVEARDVTFLGRRALSWQYAMPFQGDTVALKGVLFLNGTRVFVIFVGCPSAKAEAAFGLYRHLVSSFRLTEGPATQGVKPVEHLELAEQPVAMFGRLAMQVPAIMRPCPVADAGSQMCLGAYDQTVGKDTFFINVDMVPIDSRLTLDQLQEQYGALLAKNFKHDGPIWWKKIEAQTPVVLSDPIDTIVRLENGKEEKAICLYALVIPAPGVGVLLTFTVHQSEDLKAYSAAAENMLATIKKIDRR